MFTLAYNFYKWMKQRREKSVTIILLGLDNAGKSTLLFGLKNELPKSDVTPTIGFTPSKLVSGKYTIQYFDVGGARNFRNVWKNYYAEVHGVIFVVDAADPERFEESKETLGKALAAEGISGKPILVFANKQDLPGCLSAPDLSERMGILEFKNNRFQVSACQAKTPEGQRVDSRISKGLNWLLDSIDVDYRKLNERVMKDTEEQKIKEKERREEQKKRAEAAKAARLKEQEEAEAAAAAAATTTVAAEAATDKSGGDVCAAQRNSNEESSTAKAHDSVSSSSAAAPAAAGELDASLVSSSWVEQAAAAAAAVKIASAAEAAASAAVSDDHHGSVQSSQDGGSSARPSSAGAQHGHRAARGGREEIEAVPNQARHGGPQDDDPSGVRAAPRLAQSPGPGIGLPPLTDARRNGRLTGLDGQSPLVNPTLPPGAKIGTLRPMPPPLQTSEGGGGATRGGSPDGRRPEPLLLPNAIESPQLPRSAAGGGSDDGRVPRRYQT